EDYALLKRKRLIARGWPPSALLMTVVRDEKGEGHAVLTARTVQGDFILDNKVDEVKTWNRTRYEYVMRQSYLNTMIWMSLDPREGSSTVPIAGVRTAPRRSTGSKVLQIALKDCHLELVAELPVLVVHGQCADEIFAHVDFGRILDLRPSPHRQCLGAEHLAHVRLHAHHFTRIHAITP